MSLFGIHTFAVAPEWDLGLVEPQMERLDDYGIGLVEVPLPRPASFDAKRARAFASRWRVELVPSLGLPADLDIVDRPQEGIAFLEPALRACAEIGGFGLTGMTYGTIGKTSGRRPGQREIDGVCRFLERAARSARAHGVKLGIEPCNRYETHLVTCAVDAARIIERVGADNVFIHLDTCHMHMEEESFAAGFKAAAPFLGYVQVFEANRGVPGRGMLDWTAAFKAIAEIGYGGPITLESMIRPEIERSQAAWRSRADRPDDIIEDGLAFVREKAREAGVTLDR